MAYKFLANMTIVIHFAFIVFVVAGGLLTIWRFRIIYLHVPAVAWGAATEYFRWICPLTYLEDWFRFKAGISGPQTGFIDTYIMPIIYPPGINREMQYFIAGGLLAFNVAIWLLAWKRHKKAGYRWE